MCSSVTGNETGGAAPPPSLLSVPPPPLPLPPPPPVPPLTPLGLPALPVEVTLAPLPPCLPPDPLLVDAVLGELKSQGLFDQFRKECIADVDTKPAYQNLRQRVESAVATFLGSQNWTTGQNKNQLREKLRKYILDSNFLDQGVERIVDQVVNPKISSVFIPQVEEIFYKYLGIEKPEKTSNFNGPQNFSESAQSEENLLPNDLESVSPESVKSFENKPKELVFDATKAITETESHTTIKKESEDNTRSDGSVDSNDEDFESPAFEPLESTLKEEGCSKDSHLSGISDLTSHDSNNSAIGNNRGDCDAVGKSNVNTSNLKSHISSDSDLSSETKNQNVETDTMKIYFKNSLESIQKSQTNVCDEPMDTSVVETKPVKFDDNSSDARQCFEESSEHGISVNKTVFKSENMEVSFSENKNIEIEKTEPTIPYHRDSFESKTSIESPKVTCNMEVSVDSSESNSVFVHKNESDNANNETHSFENKFEPVVPNNDNTNGEGNDILKSENHSGENTPDSIETNVKSSENKNPTPKKEKENEGKNSHSKSSKDRERHSSSSSSKDKKDSKHHSQSSHSKHSSGKHGSDRRYSSSRDKKDDSKTSKDSHGNKDSDNKSRDRHGKSSGNGDSRRDSYKDKHSSSGHRSSSSHKSSRRSSDSKNEDCSKSRHSSSDKQDDKYKSRDLSSKNSSKSENKEKHNSNESKSSSTDRVKSSHSSGSNKDKSSSKHSSSEKYSRSNSSDDKKQDKKSKKSNKDESCSSSNRTRIRRSTDRDSNDGNGGSTKGSSNNNKGPTSSSHNSNQKNKSSNSNGENSTNGNSSQSESVNSDSVNITSGKYIKSEFNMFEFGSMGAIKRHNQERLSQSGRPAGIGNSPKSPESPNKTSNTLTIDIPSPTSKSDISSPIKSPEIPNKKPVIHIDSQLKPEKFNDIIIFENLSGEILKKPKCASNIYEAMRLRKVRREIEKLHQKRKQEAILLYEQQQNIPKNSSVAFSSESGPEVELTCMKSEEKIVEPKPQAVNENKDNAGFKYFDESVADLDENIKSLKVCISKLECCVNKSVGSIKNMTNMRIQRRTTTRKRNGFKKVLKVNIERMEFSGKKLPITVPDEVQYREINDIKLSNNKNALKSSKLNENENLQRDIFEIILGGDISFEAASISFNNEPTIECLCGDNGKIKEHSNISLTNDLGKNVRLLRKRGSTSTSDNEINLKSSNKIVNCNNNIDVTYSDKKRKLDKKLPLTENGMRSVY